MIPQGQNLLLHWILQLHRPTPHPPPKGWVLRWEPCCWCLELQGNNQGNWASTASVAAVVVLSKRACGKTLSWSWVCVMLVFNEKALHCLWLLRLCYNTDALTMRGRAKVTTNFLNEEKKSEQEIIADWDINNTPSFCQQQRLPWPIWQAASKIHRPPLFRKKKNPSNPQV